MERQLLQVIREGKIEGVKVTLETSISGDYWPYHRRHKTDVFGYRCEMVRFLIHKVPPNLWTVLNNVSEKGFFNIIKYLIDNTTLPRTAFSDAAKYGYLEIVQYLIVSRFIDIDTVNRSLIIVSSCRRFELVKILVEYGADVKAYNNCALRWASHNYDISIFAFLIEKGADRKSATNVHGKCLSYLKLLDKIKLKKAIVIQRWWRSINSYLKRYY